MLLWPICKIVGHIPMLGNISSTDPNIKIEYIYCLCSRCRNMVKVKNIPHTTTTRNSIVLNFKITNKS